jgi:uncharacterized oxidoreductase
MKTKGNTVLITGGATGIGFSLAGVFAEAGNRVIICGRREAKLAEAKRRLPVLETMVCDIADPVGRQTLLEQTTSQFPELNILVNNAGIQRQVDFRHGDHDLAGGENEIASNFEGPVHLSALFIPHLLRQQEAAIINVTSGLGFTPLAILPVYCATKAAVHSFTLSLRHQLKGTSVKVFEVIPPTVDTELDRGARDRRGQKDRGIPPDEVAKATLPALASDQFEVVIGAAARLRSDPDTMFAMINH